MDRAGYTALLAQARRLARTPDEAGDLVQDTLLAALEQDRPLQGDDAWQAAVLRRQAALRARTEIRRRTRERAVQADAPASAEAGHAATTDVRPRRFLRALPPASRQVAVLALHGLDADEVRWILGLDAPAFRQRLVRLRRALAGLAPALAEEAQQAARTGPSRAQAFEFGRLRRVLKAALHGPTLPARVVGTHDPDGHLLLLAIPGHA